MNQFRIINKLNEATLYPGAIEQAVRSFVKESHSEESGVDTQGLYQQTIENIAASTTFKLDGSRSFWIAEEDGEVMAYALTHVSKDVDNRLCYWMTQAWVHPILRGSKQVKQMYKQLTDHAKKMLCAHIIIPSSRGVKGYCRFLGEGWKPHVTLLKKDI